MGARGGSWWWWWWCVPEDVTKAVTGARLIEKASSEPPLVAYADGGREILRGTKLCGALFFGFADGGREI